MRWSMGRSVLAALVATVVVAAAPRTSAAQQWNDDRTLALVRQATERRARALADSGLVDYQATAHGYLTFLAQVGEGFREPPRVVKADELSLEVYWRAPNLSKQRIVGQRDTLLLPTDIAYHRDHLGIVQNNFPSIIRLGDGDEVVDVPHPLSTDGLADYDFSVGDSLRIQIPGRTITVDVLRVRPKDDTKPRIVGAVFVERETAQVVRMAFSFTRSSLRDKSLEDISVVLESSLVEGRFWLPSRQEIEIRRTGSWMDYPVRGIIRGRWEVCCYEVNKGIPPTFFGGPEIVLGKPRDQLRQGFTGRILDSLPDDVRAVTDEDVKKVQEEARALVRQQALTREHGASIGARGLSDIVRFDRVEGLALGGRVSRRLGHGLAASLGGRYGFDDRQAKGGATFGWQTATGSGVTLHAQDDWRDVGDEVEVSPVRNSLAAQEFGSDYTDPYRVRSVGLLGARALASGVVLRLDASIEEQRALSVHAVPASGRFRAPVAAAPLHAARYVASLERPTVLAPLGFTVRGAIELRLVAPYGSAADSAGQVVRAAASVWGERPLGPTTLALRTTIAHADAARGIPAQELVWLGGPTSGPGYDYHSFAAATGATGHLELRARVPFPSFPLGRFGRTPGEATIAPFVHAIWADGVRVSPNGSGGVFPAAGLGLASPFELLRLDVARGFRDGRWTFSIDIDRQFWSVL
ncbi:MAG: hypothetical protein ACJ79K_10520 [Gemmatimonadaceae bacterium]